MGTYSNTVRSRFLLFLMIFGSVALTSCASAELAKTNSTNERVTIVVGDLHGDYKAFVSIMNEAGLIDDTGRWSGGNSRFVQTGDIPDRGPDTRKILDHMMKLEKQAKRSGGEIVALIGNHEAMNITGDLRYVDSGEYEAFVDLTSTKRRNDFYRANRDNFTDYYLDKDPTLKKEQIRAAFDTDYPLGYVEHRRAWAPDGKYGSWVISHNAIQVIDRTLFVHGGISESVLSNSIVSLNSKIKKALRKEGATEILTDERGPLWYRGNATETETGAIEIETVLKHYNVDHIVIGHTPSMNGIKMLYDGRVVVVDTGIASHYGGKKSFLSINGNTFTANDDGLETVLFVSERAQ